MLLKAPLAPESLEWVTSRGFFSERDKYLMRISAWVSDLVFYISGFLYLYRHRLGPYPAPYRYQILLLQLCSPLLILIDHGHFQYNAVMSGLAL